MKIVHVEDVFHPDTGYQLNILSKYMVAAGHEVTIITSEVTKLPEKIMNFFGVDDIVTRDALFTKRYGVKIIRVPILGYYSGRAIFTNKIFQTIKNESPSVVYMHGNDTLTSIRYLCKLKSYNYPLIMDSHMLEMASENKFSFLFRGLYRLFITPIIKKHKIKIIRTQDSEFLKKAYNIPLEQAPWISTGSDTMLFKPDSCIRKRIREKLQIDDNEFVVTYAGKLDESKGGMLLGDTIEAALETERNICFLIIGNTIGDYGKELENKFRKSNNRIIRMPTQKYEDLAKYFQTSDLIIFPKQCSLTFYDAQACGVPVLFETNEINNNRAKYGGAITFESGSQKDFREKIIALANLDAEQYQKMSAMALSFIKESYDYKMICERYLDIIYYEIEQYKLHNQGTVE